MAPAGLSVIVIGGGAAGFFGAIAAAEASPQASITLLEGGRDSLTKVRLSGGGRCNVTHSCFDPALLAQQYPRGGRALRGAFSRFQPQDTVAWFQRRGVRLKTEADGRMFPTTDDSATIVNCLQAEARRVGIQVRTRAAVTNISQTVRQSDPPFRVELKSGEVLWGDRILMATGSSPIGYRLAAGLGHRIVPPVPSLFTFTVRDTHLQALAGVSAAPVTVSLRLPESKPLSQTGPLLITHWGFSGPAVLKLSAWGARSLHQHRYRAILTVNWLPDRHFDALRTTLLDTKATWAKRQLTTQSPFPLTKRLWQYLLQHRAQLSPDLTWANLSKKQLNTLINSLLQDDYTVSGKGQFKDEFVTCGGIPLPEVNFKTLESRRCPGLFFAGEILDVDGITGGFNFQNAWTTGWIAGQSMARSAEISKSPSVADKTSESGQTLDPARNRQNG
ncbi:aminoacetone oxidase family FAD-binding enzyme [filamentous cyanobacterium CCP5]|nr:aminoacetone oxidase family FAD-binding enzyme [filamentous cyanobacterium CCP5]